MLREAVARTNAQPLIASLFGHALIATEDQANLDEAARVLKASVTKDNENPFAWYQLGVVYEHKGDAPRAALASAESFYLQNRPYQALASARAAMNGIAQGTPDWIRAQDIALISETFVQDKKRKKR